MDLVIMMTNKTEDTPGVDEGHVECLLSWSREGLLGNRDLGFTKRKIIPTYL